MENYFLMHLFILITSILETNSGGAINRKNGTSYTIINMQQIINIYYNYNQCSLGTYIEVNDFKKISINHHKELIHYLFKKNIGLIDLNILTIENISEPYYLNLSIWKFNNDHLKWLNAVNNGKYHFIEINNKLK